MPNKHYFSSEPWALREFTTGIACLHIGSYKLYEDIKAKCPGCTSITVKIADYLGNIPVNIINRLKEKLSEISIEFGPAVMTDFGAVLELIYNMTELVPRFIDAYEENGYYFFRVKIPDIGEIVFEAVPVTG